MILHKANDVCIYQAKNDILNPENIHSDVIYTGYKAIDEILGGMLPGELYMIGARPGMGKSCFTYNLLCRMCIEHGVPALLFSLKSSAEDVIQKMIAMISMREIGRSHEENHSLEVFREFEEATKKIRKSPIRIEDSLSLTLNAFNRRCREIRRDGPVRVVFLDSWDNMHFSPKPDKATEIEALRQIKSLAYEMGITIVINMNLSREIEYRETHYPTIHDFMIPVSALEEASGVMTLYRKAYYGYTYHPDCELLESFKVDVFRSRQSKCGKSELLFRPSILRIDEWNGEEFTKVLRL